jgi:hypothetical protein
VSGELAQPGKTKDTFNTLMAEFENIAILPRLKLSI